MGGGREGWRKGGKEGQKRGREGERKGGWEEGRERVNILYLSVYILFHLIIFR